MRLKSAKTEVMLKGKVSKRIIHSRGLLQKDIISSLLFILFADGLDRIICKAKEVA